MATLRDDKGRFIKGSANPWNKGLRGFVHPGSFRKGTPSWNKGKPAPWTKTLPWLFKKGENLGERHPRWRGNKVKYSGLHMWIGRNLGKPSRCEFCEKDNLSGNQIHWANKSGEYRRDFTDWLRLCVKCHSLYDKKKGQNGSTVATN